MQAHSGRGGYDISADIQQGVLMLRLISSSCYRTNGVGFRVGGCPRATDTSLWRARPP